MSPSLSKKTLGDIRLSDHRRAVVRLDLNVPIADGAIADEHRITAALPTLNTLLEAGVRAVVLSHLSRIKSPEDISSGKKSLRIVAEALGRLLPGRRVTFVPSTDFASVRAAVEGDAATDVFVLENTRYYDLNDAGEAVKRESKNDPELAKFWASLGDLFVNDAFGTAHRSHASNAGIARHLPSAMGRLMEREVECLSAALDPSKSMTFVMGGSKVSDKLKLIKFIAPKAERVLIGGGMAYTFLKAMGKEVGKSLVEDDMLEECRALLDKYGPKLLLPTDHLVSPEFKDLPVSIRSADDRDWSGEMALDIGPETVDRFRAAIREAKIVVWNGPMGVFEFSNYEHGTRAIAMELVAVTKLGAYTVVGGGDSAAAIKRFGLSSGVSFVSTGGGASLAFFEGAPMPGIESISDR